MILLPSATGAVASPVTNLSVSTSRDAMPRPDGRARQHYAHALSPCHRELRRHRKHRGSCTNFGSPKAASNIGGARGTNRSGATSSESLYRAKTGGRPVICGFVTGSGHPPLLVDDAVDLDLGALAAHAERIVLTAGQESRGYPAYEVSVKLGQKQGPAGRGCRRRDRRRCRGPRTRSRNRPHTAARRVPPPWARVGSWSCHCGGVGVGRRRSRWRAISATMTTPRPISRYSEKRWMML